ncbi:MAG: hypothetical protein ACK56I_12015, partial [bacterium]
MAAHGRGLRSVAADRWGLGSAHQPRAMGGGVGRRARADVDASAGGRRRAGILPDEDFCAVRVGRGLRKITRYGAGLGCFVVDVDFARGLGCRPRA